MSTQIFKISIDMTEAALLLAEVTARLEALGPDEAARRIGAKVDRRYLQSLYRIVSVSGKSQMRVEITPEFDALLQRLWSAI